MLYKLGFSTLWMFVLTEMHPNYCYMLSGSCTLPPCSCSLLGYSMRLPGSCPLPPMPDSFYTSLERVDQSFVYKSAKPSRADQRPPCFICSASLPWWVFVLPAGLRHAAAVLLLAAGLLLHAAAGLLLAAADAQLCLHVTYLKPRAENADQSFTSRNDSRHLRTP